MKVRNIMFKRIDHVEIISSDANRSVQFYIEALGFELKQILHLECGHFRRVIYLGLGESMIEILDMKNPKEPVAADEHVGYRAIALEVDDMDDAIASLSQAGVEPAWGPADLGDSIRAEIKDPDGLTIELRQWRWKPGVVEDLAAHDSASEN